MSKTSKLIATKGFTIVELLVVIVVIGVLAAITVVSYTGVTNRANTAANNSNAGSVLAAAQVVYANTSAWPTASANPVTALNASDAKIPTGMAVSNAQLAAGTTIQYLQQGTTGVCVGYWDYADSEDVDGTAGAKWLYGGTATNGTNGASPSCA